MAPFWRTFHHDSKIIPAWWGWGVHALPLSLYLPSRAKLWCTLQLRGQIHFPYFYSTPICTLCSLYRATQRPLRCMPCRLRKVQKLSGRPPCKWAKRRWKGDGVICLFCNNGCAEAFGASQSLKISLHNTSTKEIANTSYYKGLFQLLFLFTIFQKKKRSFKKLGHE